MIALYKRLSLADGDVGAGGKSESNSIERQGDLLRSFVASRREFTGVKTVDYVDDGYTGTNFDRPAFKKMMEGVKSGKIDTIIVKDISRFGRDYIGVGEYLEQLFPLLGIRFIAVNNNYDSSRHERTGLNLDMALNNLINTMYSRDIGKKLRCSNEIRWKKGYSTGSSAPFGYVFDPARKGRFMIDREAADIVRYIFDLALKGYGTSMIAYELNEKKLPIPSEYNRLHNIHGKKRQYTLTPDKIWNSAKVWRILRSYEYTGAMVLGKSRVIMPGTDIVRNVPAEERYITENTHTPIVTREEWKRAQEVIRKKSAKSYEQKRDLPLKKKIRCGHCMRVMHYNMRLDDPKVWCREGVDMPKHSGCRNIRYSMEKIEKCVWPALHMFIKLMAALNGRIAEHEKEKYADNIKRDDRFLQVRKERIELYREYAEKNISLDAYKQKKKTLEKKIRELDASDEMLQTGRRQDIDIPPEVRHMAEESVKYVPDNRLTVQSASAYIKNVYVHDESHIEIQYCCEDEVRECLAKFDIGISENEWYGMKYVTI